MKSVDQPKKAAMVQSDAAFREHQEKQAARAEEHRRLVAEIKQTKNSK